jgi:nucleotide-binding universal stress UspA family protein
MRITGISLATDRSPASGPAFDEACALAREHGARLLIVHVDNPMLLSIPPMPPLSTGVVEQWFNADPPGFVWWGRLRLFPGLWIDARDRSVQGAGDMLVSAESTVTLADTHGPEMDEAALHRLLGEMPWFPTALLDERSVTWSPVDDHRASASLRVNGRTVSGVFTFEARGLVSGFDADRRRDVGGGKTVLTPFHGDYADFRVVEGVLVPHTLTGSWDVDGRRIPYARFAVDELEDDVAASTP